MAASAISSAVTGRCGDMLGVWMAPVTAEVAQLALVVRQQVLHQAACVRRARVTWYCRVEGCSIASKLTGSRAGSRSSSAWMVKCSPPANWLPASRWTLTLRRRRSWRATACSSERQMAARS
ncbi:hypothetical protein G6F58_013598 [Rhizopus delemar]|nr:hypothetical protein G6F58_013598 [Rhizopus delemar]